MLNAILDKQWIQWTLISAMVIVTAICVFKTPDIIFLKRISSHAIHIMILLLGAGLFFLIVNKPRLLFTAFGCVALMCLYFKRVANIDLILPVKTTEATMQILQTSTSDLAEDLSSSLRVIKHSKVDMITILEVTPDWEQRLLTELGGDFPYHALRTNIDITGMAIFSKFPILGRDTLEFAEVPHLSVQLKVGDHSPQFISLYSNPPLFRRSLLQLRNQLNGLANHISTLACPILVAGDFNIDQFSDEIQDFRNRASLLDSRKTMSPSLNTPTNHIFYNKDFECLRFYNVYDNSSYRIGVIGEYQFKSLLK